MKEEEKKGHPLPLSLPRKATSLAHAVTISTKQVNFTTIITTGWPSSQQYWCFSHILQISPRSRLCITIAKETSNSVWRVDRGGRAQRGWAGEEEDAAVEAAAGGRLGVLSLKWEWTISVLKRLMSWKWRVVTPCCCDSWPEHLSVRLYQVEWICEVFPIKWWNTTSRTLIDKLTVILASFNPVQAAFIPFVDRFTMLARVYLCKTVT